MLKSSASTLPPKTHSFPKLMHHKCGSVILASAEGEDGVAGMVVFQGLSGRYPVGSYRVDWIELSDFIGSVQLQLTNPD